MLAWLLQTEEPAIGLPNPNRSENFQAVTTGDSALLPAQEQAENDANARMMSELSPVRHRVQPEPSATAEFRRETAIKVEAADGKYNYRLENSLDKHILFSTEASEAGLKEARERLAEIIEEKTRAIETTYGITIAREGEDALQQRTTLKDCNMTKGHMIKTRSASLPELVGLEAALSRSQPSEQGGDGKEALKIYFLTENMYTPGTVSAHYTESDMNNHRAIFIDPTMLKHAPVYADDAGNGSDRYYSIQAIFTHEIGHNSEYNMGWNHPEVQIKRAASFGWTSIDPEAPGRPGWLRNGKDGEFYKYDYDDCNSPKAWIRTDAKGERLNFLGQVVSSLDKAQHVTKLDKLSQDKPATDYFTSPREEFAEGLMLFRLGGRDRSRLHRINPALYETIKEHDQEEIDERYSKEPSAQPDVKYMRSVDGTVVPVSQGEQARVKELEQ